MSDYTCDCGSSSILNGRCNVCNQLLKSNWTCYFGCDGTTKNSDMTKDARCIACNVSRFCVKFYCKNRLCMAANFDGESCYLCEVVHNK